MKTLLKILIIPVFALLVSCTIDVPVQGGGGPMPMQQAQGFNPGNGYRPPMQYGGQQGYYGRPPMQYGGGYQGQTQYGGGSSPIYYGGSGPNGAGQTIYHGSQAHHVYGDGPQFYANPN